MTAISDSITIDADPGERSQALVDMLQQIAHDYAPAALASSLSIEDMVVTDAILRHDIPLEIFTLDTGRMHQDTLDLIDTIERHYGTRIRVYLPDPKAVMRYVAQHGRDAFYESVELRR